MSHKMRLADPLPRLAGIAVLRRLEVADLAVFQAYRHDPLIMGIVESVNVRSARLLERVGMRMVESRPGIFRDAPCIDHVYSIRRNS